MASQPGLNTPKSARSQSCSKPSQSNSSTSKVRVVVRVRPFLTPEIHAEDGNPIACASVLNPDFQSETNEVAVHLKDQETSRNECYKLDSFYGQDDSVHQIFDNEVNPLIPSIFHGCNATVFAYGATGSGKTHTIQGTNEMPGLMSLTMSTIFPMCESAGSVTEISYYEIYMDRCYDLLEPKTEEIKVLDDKEGQAQLRGLSRVPVNSMAEFHQVLSRGIQRRKVAHTGLNDISSRSHGVLVIAVSNLPSDGSKSVVMGKLNLIDLAGNEDNRRTCNEGIRLQESAKINQSLFTLSNVIHALNNNKPRVPYRESKLTRILQDSLGGTSRALMIACLNPGEYQESVYTVSLASRSRYCVSSAQTIETPKVKMEARLRTWLESKEKTKNAHKIGGFGSPSFSRTPLCMSSTKKNKNLYKSSGKEETTTTKQAVSHTKERNRVNYGAQVVSLMEDMCLDKVEEHEDSSGNSQNESRTESTDNLVVPPFDEDHFNSYNGTSNNGAVEDKKENNSFTVWANVLYSVTNLPGKCLENENTASPCNSAEPPVVSEMVKEVQTPLRKALSPINFSSNVKPVEDVPSKDQLCIHLSEPKTPKTPQVFTRDDEFQVATTPLDKFNARSSNLKNTLVQEYLAVLNSASKEELMGLKGIGQKRAECILELRETSPLRSLNDLEKIGLSSKQVNNIFRKTASGIFS